MKTPLMKVDFSEKELLYLVLISEQGSVKKMEICHDICHQASDPYLESGCLLKIINHTCSVVGETGIGCSRDVLSGSHALLFK